METRAVSRDDEHDEHHAGIGPATVLTGLAGDVGLPLVAYYALHALGVGDVVALLTGSLLAGLRVAWVALRERRLNPFAAAVLVALGLGCAMVLISGDARFLLLKGSVVTAVIALAFLVTAATARPLTLAAEQSWRPRRAAELAAEFARDADVRHGHRVACRVWGLGLLIEAVVRSALVYVLPVEVMVGLSTAMIVATLAGLAVWTGRYLRRQGPRPAGA